MVTVNRKATWLQWLAPERFDNKNLFRIVTFFVFHSPVADLSSMKRTLKEYGWNTPWKKPIYLNKQLKQASTSKNLLYAAATNKELDKALKTASLDGNFEFADFSRECICFYDNQKNQFMSVFYHLRNAFAHCRLNMVEVDGECVFLLEDVKPSSKDKLVLTARMILRESTLLNWIDIIEGGEQPYSLCGTTQQINE